MEPDPLLNLPLGQVVQDEAPAELLYLPAGQEVQPVEVYEFEP